MLNRELSWGSREHPADLTTVWGARWIFPDDMVADRQDFINSSSPDGQKLMKWLNGGAIGAAIEKARLSAKSGMITEKSSITVILHEDETGIIKGNPNGSFGYLYVCGYLKGR